VEEWEGRRDYTLCFGQPLLLKVSSVFGGLINARGWGESINLEKTREKNEGRRAKKSGDKKNSLENTTLPDRRQTIGLSDNPSRVKEMSARGRLKRGTLEKNTPPTPGHRVRGGVRLGGAWERKGGDPGFPRKKGKNSKPTFIGQTARSNNTKGGRGKYKFKSLKK